MITRATAIVQARLGSSRLPNKVLADVCGRPMISLQIERMMLCENLRGIVIAIPEGADNDKLAGYCLMRGWRIYRGSEYDVLSRYLGAAEYYGADVIVRVTADCPLIDPYVIDAAVVMFDSGDYDFVSNNLIPSFPHGLDVEVMSRGTLAIAAQEAKTAFDREHVTPWITRATAGGRFFRLGNLPCPMDLSGFRLTVDYPEDLQVVRSIYQNVVNPDSIAEVIGYLTGHPEVRALNAKYPAHQDSSSGEKPRDSSEKQVWPHARGIRSDACGAGWPVRDLRSARECRA